MLNKTLQPVVFFTLAAAFLVSGTAFGSDLTLNGTTSVVTETGSSLSIQITGAPQRPALLLLDIDPGPSTAFGEQVPLGFTPFFQILLTDFTAPNGVVQWNAMIPSDGSLAGVTVYFAGVVLDETDPNGKDFSNGADLTIRLPTDAGGSQGVMVGVPTALDGSALLGPDLSTLPGAHIQWQIINRPPGSQAALEEPTTPFPRLIPDLPGDYLIRMTASNGVSSWFGETTVHAWELTLLSGNDGSFVGGNEAFVSGRIEGPTIADASLNGNPLSLDAAGNFGPVSVPLDANTLHTTLMVQVEHPDGTLARERSSLIQGIGLPFGFASLSSLAAQLEQQDMPVVEQLAADILAEYDIESILLDLPPEEVINTERAFGFTIFSAYIDFTGLTYDMNILLQLDPTVGGIQGQVILHNVRADFNVWGEVLEIDYNLDGYITSDPTIISSTLVGSTTGGQLSINVQNVQVDRQNFDFELNGFIGTIAEIFVIESAVKEDVEDTVAGLVQTELGPALAEILGEFSIAINLYDALEVDVNILAPIASILHSDHGVSLILNGAVGVGSVEPGSPPITQYRTTPSSPYPFSSTTTSGVPYGTGLTVSDDFLNQAMAAATAAGLLNGNLSSLFPQKGKSPVSLYVEDLAFLFPSSGFHHFPDGTELRLAAFGTVPPIIQPTPGGTAMADVHLQNLIVEFVAPTNSGEVPLLRVGIDGVASVDLNLDSRGLLVATPVATSLTISHLRSFPGADTAAIDQSIVALEVLLNFVIIDLLASLGGIPLPSLESQGLGVVPFEVGLEGDHAIFWGNLTTLSD